MEHRRLREIVLAVVAALGIAVVAYKVRATAPAPTAASQARNPASATVAAAKPSAQKNLSAQKGSLAQKNPSELDLSALNAPKAEPQEVVRNPFRFKPKPPPPPPPMPVGPAVGQTGPVEPPAPPPIPLKFFGVFEIPGKGLVASLTDGRGVYRGAVGDTIEGRYRILRIGVESLDLAYLDGRGRQTIRFTGQ